MSTIISILSICFRAVCLMTLLEIMFMLLTLIYKYHDIYDVVILQTRADMFHSPVDIRFIN